MNTRGKAKGLAKSTRSKVAAAAAAKRGYADDVLPPKKAPSRRHCKTAKRKRTTKPAQPESTVSFQAEVVVVSVTQANTSIVSQDNRTVHQSVSSFWQILQQHEPKSFKVSFDTNEAWSTVQITLDRDTLPRFPMLVDMELKTPPGTDSTVPFQPPWTSLPFVAAAALLEEPLDCTKWLCSSNLGLSLAAATLEVAEFLQASTLISTICNWLPSLFAASQDVELQLQGDMGHIPAKVLEAVPDKYLAEIPKQVLLKDTLRCSSALLQQWIRASRTVDLTSMQRDLTERESPELCEKVMKSLSQVPDIPKLVVNLELERDESAAVKMRMQPLFLEATDGLAALNVRELVLCGAEVRPGDGGQLQALGKVFPIATTVTFQDLDLGEPLSDVYRDLLNITHEISMELTSTHACGDIGPQPNYVPFFECLASLKHLKELRLTRANFEYMLGIEGKDAQALCGFEGLKVVGSDTGEAIAEVKGGDVVLLPATSATAAEPGGCLNASQLVMDGDVLAPPETTKAATAPDNSVLNAIPQV